MLALDGTSVLVPGPPLVPVVDPVVGPAKQKTKVELMIMQAEWIVAVSIKGFLCVADTVGML